MEDDLTWLVRITGGTLEPWCEFIARSGCDSWACARVFDLERNWFTKEQYMACRAELQNKPGWNDAPEWANWLCQRDDGMWFWCIEEPRVSESGWETRHEARAAYPSGDQIPEHVLGDWRDTLERRPVDLSEPAVTARLTEATENVLAAAPALMDEKFSIDRNDWFERGERPPLGRCMVKHKQADAEWAKPGFHEKNIVAAGEKLFIERDDDGQEFVGAWDDYEFRPTRTERDLAVDEMMKCTLGVMSQETQRRLFEDLYDAGYRKQNLPAK